MLDLTNFLKNLEKLISYKSVLGKPSENAPFGKEVRGALSFFLNLAKDFGFETVDYDGYAGEVCFGSGQEVGIVGHLDVVPTGIGWNTDPFTLTEKDGVLYGRGVSDDKTPLLSCLYALKELRDSKRTINKKFRLILGCNEETGWQDIAYMKTKTTFPEYGFSPDGNFPLTYAEKGITEVSFTLPKLKNFVDIKGGTVVNAVCDYASVISLKPIDFENIEKFNLKVRDGNLIESFGKAAHGSTPEKGKNAILPLLQYLESQGEDVKTAIDCLFLDKFSLTKLGSEQGFITLSPDLIKEDENGVTITCDCRIPAPLTLENHAMPIFNKFGLPVKTKVRHEPSMVEKEGAFVSALLNAYNTVTGENAQPQSSGGVTFSRVFKRGCAFGPKFAFHNDQIHDANENIPIKNLLTAYEIYKKAIFDLNDVSL